MTAMLNLLEAGGASTEKPSKFPPLMKQPRILTAGAVMLASMLALSSCSFALNERPTAQDIAGTWSGPGASSFVFYGDKSCVLTDVSQAFLGKIYGPVKISVPRGSCRWSIGTDPNDKAFGYYWPVKIDFAELVAGSKEWAFGYDTTERSYPVLVNFVNGDEKRFMQRVSPIATS